MAFQWCPTSMKLLISSEEKLLEGLTAPKEVRLVKIGRCVGETDNLIRTLIFNKDGTGTPALFIRGFAAALATWLLNIDALARDRPVIVIDVLSFGGSSRPKFSSDAREAEDQIVKSIALLMTTIGYEKFILIGHSMGGFLSSAFAQKHPDRVVHLVLADPWGFPDRAEPPGNDAAQLHTPLWWKLLDLLHRMANPLFLLRAAGPFGLTMTRRCGSYLYQKFEGAVENAVETLSQYLFQCNARTPTGESAFHSMMVNSNYARFPMVDRIMKLPPLVPITFIYGVNSWIDRQPGRSIKERWNGPTVKLNVLHGAGHHVYADRSAEFNHIVMAACVLGELLHSP